MKQTAAPDIKLRVLDSVLFKEEDSCQTGFLKVEPRYGRTGPNDCSGRENVTHHAS